MDWSLSVSSNSSMELAGSRETSRVLSPMVVGFQYRVTSMISPLSMLGKTISSFLAPSSYREMAKFEAVISPSLRISVLTSRKVLTYVSLIGIPYSSTDKPVLNIRLGAGGSLSTSTTLLTSSE